MATIETDRPRSEPSERTRHAAGVAAAYIISRGLAKAGTRHTGEQDS